MHRLGNLFPGSFQHFSHRGTKKGLMVPVRASETFRAPCASGKSRIDAPPPPRVLLKQACRSCCKNASCGKNAPFFFPIPNFFPKPHVDDILMGTGTIVHYLTKTHTHTPVSAQTNFYINQFLRVFAQTFIFTSNTFCRNTFLHQPFFTQTRSYTNVFLHKPPFTPTSSYTNEKLHTQTHQLVRKPIFRSTNF